MADPICLTSSDINELVASTEISDYLNVVRDGYHQRGEGAPAKPRTRLHPNDGPWGMLTSYMAILPETGAMGGYMYDIGFESQDAWLSALLWDSTSGEFLAHLDGSKWNSYKTGATGAVGIDALARKSADTLGLLGSGTQARTQLLAAAEVRDLKTVRVYSPTPENRIAFAAEMDSIISADVIPAESSTESVTDSDIIVTATTAREPVFDGADLQPGTHITAVGQYHPTVRELDIETIKRAKYVPDLRERSFQDAGSFLHALEEEAITKEHIYAELGDIVAGKVTGRESDDEITVFDSGGTAIETVAVAHLLYEMAIKQDIGTPIDVLPVGDV